MITQAYYVSTGRKNAMYTLRCLRHAPGLPSFAEPDFYICNLAADEEKALEKAVQYVETMRDRIGETEEFKIIFDGICARADKRRGNLSINDTRKIETIESGIFPFGKHQGTSIADAPDSYILFFADKSKEVDLNPVMQALAAACMGYALERGLIGKREVARAERREIDSQSNFIGTVGERRDFTGEVITAFEKRPEFDNPYWINKVRCGADIVTYIGSKALGAVGETISFRATIKKQEEYNGIKTTAVSRPAK